MFDQIKMNKLNPVNLIKGQEKENLESMQKKPESDFYAMIMEKAFESEQTITEKLSSIDGQLSHDDSKIKGQSSAERYSVPDSDHRTEETARERDYRKTSDRINIVQKEITEKRKIETDFEQTAGFINFLSGENNIKKIREIIRSALSGDKKNINEKLLNLFREFKFRSVQNGFLKTSSTVDDFTKITRQFTPEQLKDFSKKFRELLSVELMKFTGGRKDVRKINNIKDNDLNAIIISVIDKIKKTKPKEVSKLETKSWTEEIRTEKKQFLTHEGLAKKFFFKEDSFSDKNNTGDRNSGRDNINNTSVKTDFLGRTGIDKSLTETKSMNFRENLQELIDRAKISVRDSRNGSFTVRLNPRELGNVNVNLIMENGVITGKFLVDNDHVKNQLMDNLMYLKHQLEESGISVGEFSVNVNNQRGEFLNQNDENVHVYLPLSDSGRDIIAASEQYLESATLHNGYINMVI